ncbi:MAG: hypothetical protein WC130_11175 [Kiritimatiellia bacterium]|jgi:hypothetical protein
MKKTITVFLLVLAGVAFAQSPTAGLNMSVNKQMVKGGDSSKSIGKTEPKLDVEVMNTLAVNNKFDLDVIFIGTFNPGKNAQRFIRKMLKFQVALAPMGKQTISADSILWFDSHKEPNAVFPRGSSGFSAHEGWNFLAI